MGEGAGVGVADGGAEGREAFGASAVAGEYAGEAVGVGLDPGGDIAGVGVLPRAKPEDDELEVVSACSFEEAVDCLEIEFAFFGFDGLPGDGEQYGVEMHCREPRPDGLHVVDAGRAGVVELSAEDEEGLASDDELGGAAALFEVGWSCFGGGSLAESCLAEDQ